MHLHDILRSEFAKFGHNALRIVETGTIRGTNEPSRVGDGWSTQFFAHWLAEHDGGELIAIDLHTATVPMVLTEDEMKRVVLRQGHSIAELSHLLSMRDTLDVDVAFLDSDNDAQLILHEFMIARELVCKGGLIIIDDVHMPHHPSAEPRAKKGDLVWPYVRELSLPHRVHEREGWASYRAGVLVIEV